jgi:hypothetical protein
MNTEQELRLLKIELEKTRAEANQLRKRLGENNRHKRRIDRAYDDALLMVFWWSVGIRPSRRFAALYGINQYRWENAVGLLRMARIMQGRSRWTKVEVEQAEKRLTAAKERALLDSQLFFLRLNKHHQRGEEI